MNGLFMAGRLGWDQAREPPGGLEEGHLGTLPAVSSIHFLTHITKPLAPQGLKVQILCGHP